MSVRPPAVAGSFYPGEASAITMMLNEIFSSEQAKINKKLNPSQIIGGIVPHAGYKYSANEAIHFFHFLRNTNQRFDTFIIINPCHHGSEEDICLDSHMTWQTPLGEIPLDAELMEFLNIPSPLMLSKMSMLQKSLFLTYSFS